MSFPDQSCDDWMSCCTWLVVERDKFKERSYKTILRTDLLQYLLYFFLNMNIHIGYQNTTIWVFVPIQKAEQSQEIEICMR